MKKIVKEVLIGCVSCAVIISVGLPIGLYIAETNKGIKVSISSSDLNTNIEDFLNFDTREFLEKDLTEFDKNLAKEAYFSQFTTSDSYQVTVTSDSINTSGNYSLLREIGYKNIEQISVGSNDDLDVNDTVRVLFATNQIDEENEILKVIVFPTGPNNEWSSNLDVGNSSEFYLNNTGEHPDWENKLNHKGFDVAAKRVKKSLEDYSSKNVDSFKNTIVSLNGWSRGGAIANILGSQLEDNKVNIGNNKYKCSTYTFAAPNVTEDTNAANYETIFNISVEEDVVTLIPPSSFGMKRFGKDYLVSLNSRKLRKQYNKLTGIDFDGSTQLKAIEDIDAVLCARANLFDVDESLVIKKKFDTYEEATSYLSTLQNTFRLEGLIDFVVFNGIDETNEVVYYFSYGFVFKLISNLINNAAAMEVTEILGKIKYVNCAKLSFIILDIMSISFTTVLNCHTAIGYYLAVFKA